MYKYKIVINIFNIKRQMWKTLFNIFHFFSLRELRNVKNKQKISGYFKSIEVANIYLKIKSIITTCKKKALDFYEIIKNIYNNTLVIISKRRIPDVLYSE